MFILKVIEVINLILLKFIGMEWKFEAAGYVVKVLSKYSNNVVIDIFVQ